MRIVQAALSGKMGENKGGGKGSNVLLALFTLAIGVRVLLVFVVPPLVDVYYYDSQAVSTFLSGADPYGHLYTGIPQWLATAGAERVYAYMPGVFLSLAPFGAAWDVRAGLVAADLVVAWSLYSLGGSRAKRASLVFFLAPWGFLFSTSYPNNNLVAMAFLGIAMLCEFRNHGLVSSVSLGAAMGSSQFAWLVYPFVLLRYIRERRYREVIVSLATGAAVVAPFLVWNPDAFLSNAVFFQFSRPTQGVIAPEAFGLNFNPTLSGLLQTVLGTSVPLIAKGAAATAALALLLYRAQDWPGSLNNSAFFVLAAIFFLPNDFSWWYLELPFQLLLAGYVLRGLETPQSRERSGQEPQLPRKSGALLEDSLS